MQGLERRFPPSSSAVGTDYSRCSWRCDRTRHHTDLRQLYPAVADKHLHQKPTAKYSCILFVKDKNLTPMPPMVNHWSTDKIEEGNKKARPFLTLPFKGNLFYEYYLRFFCWCLQRLCYLCWCCSCRWYLCRCRC